MPKLIDITGKKFNRLKVVEISHRIKNKSRTNIYWKCICECGKTTNALACDLKDQKKKSCGCLNLEKVKGNKRNNSHGFHGTNFYRLWCGIKYRCLNPKSHNYKYYGDRGIKICEEWKTFINFKNDMYESYLKHIKKYGKNTSIDRINNNGNYSKENCRWATSKQQQNNRHKTYK